MVSIPDWAKFSRKTEDSQKQDSTALLNKYYKQREAEAIKQAEKTGYFLEPSKDYLLKHFGPLSGTTKDLSRIFFVRLSGLHLRKLGDLHLLSSLQICVLHSNFLTKIDALSSCQQLVKLDLHGNQLTSIPGPTFWAALRKLRALYLHDNPLGKFETLQSLSTAPVLSIVTLYDTPLYLKKNYRHHVVNSVWSLKALDHHVVSDEEIIEDALFGGTFTLLSPSFRLDLCPPSPPGCTYRQEVRLFHRLEAQIHTILARHSPVIIVQRYVRGYLARKRLGLVKPRPRGSIARAPPGDVLMMPPVSQRYSASTHSQPSTGPRHSLTAPSQTGHVPPPSPTPSLALGGAGDARAPHLYINLAKLQTGTLTALRDEADRMDGDLGGTSRSELVSRDRQRTRTRSKDRDRSKDREGKPKKIKSVRQFFGPVVPSTDDVSEVDEGRDWGEWDDDGDEPPPITHYRLRGRQPTVVLTDPTTDMILSRVEAGKAVREAELDRVATARSEPAPRVQPHSFRNNDQRLFSRVHGTMGLSCLFAVQKAYRDREKAEKATAKMEYIWNMREERQRAKERIQVYQDEKRSQAMRRRDQDRARILDALEKRELLRLNYLDRQSEAKARLQDVSKSLQADQTFMVEFNSQHTSVSKALLRHDRQARVDERLSTRKDKTTGLRHLDVEQQETVKKYMEHRQLMRQTETAMARAALDTRTLQETTERVMEAKQRVAHCKAKQASVQAFYPLPPSNVPPGVATAPAGMSRFEAAVTNQQGR